MAAVAPGAPHAKREKPDQRGTATERVTIFPIEVACVAICLGRGPVLLRAAALAAAFATPAHHATLRPEAVAVPE